MTRRVCSVILLVLACALLPPPALADRKAAEQAVAEGDELLKRHDSPGAIAAYSRAIEADPSWTTAYGRRSRVERLVGLHDAGIEDLCIAMRLDPADDNLRFTRCQAYLEVSRTQEAVEDCDLLLRHRPNVPAIFAIYGKALVLSGQIDRGLEMQNKAVAAAPPDQVLRIRHDAYFLKADWEALLDETSPRSGGNPNVGGTSSSAPWPCWSWGASTRRLPSSKWPPPAK